MNSLDNVFSSIYEAIVSSQNAIEQHYVNEIKKDYYKNEIIVKKLY